MIQKDHQKGTTPLKLLTLNMPTDDLENSNGASLGRDLLLVNKPWSVPRGTDLMSQGGKGTGKLLYIDQHIPKDSETRRKI